MKQLLKKYQAKITTWMMMIFLGGLQATKKKKKHKQDADAGSADEVAALLVRLRDRLDRASPLGLHGEHVGLRHRRRRRRQRPRQPRGKGREERVDEDLGHGGALPTTRFEVR